MLFLRLAQTLAWIVAGGGGRNHHHHHHQRQPLQHVGTKTATVLRAAAFSDSEDGGLEAARAMLFEDQHLALVQQAEQEKQVLDPRMKEMKNAVTSKKKKKRRPSAAAGVGFGGGNNKAKTTTTTTTVKLNDATQLLANHLEEQGVVLVPGVLSKETAAACRESVLKELERMRTAIRQDPSLSVSLFYVPADIHFSTPRGYVLLPLRDSSDASIDDKTDNVDGPIVQAVRELLQSGSQLSDLFGTMCNGESSQLYDFCALRTQPGAGRQVVHSDTPFQETPGLFSAFIALQDVRFEMGGTMFFPGTHVQSKERLGFDNSNNKDAMLRASKPEYTMLKAGDAALFDMRTLHAGLENQKQGGAQRLLLNVTFRNLKAKQDLAHKPNLRPDYVGKYTLGGVHEELASNKPFASAGNGLLPGVGEGVLL